MILLNLVVISLPLCNPYLTPPVSPVYHPEWVVSGLQWSHFLSHQPQTSLPLALAMPPWFFLWIISYEYPTVGLRMKTDINEHSSGDISTESNWSSDMVIITASQGSLLTLQMNLAPHFLTHSAMCSCLATDESSRKFPPGLLDCPMAQTHFKISTRVWLKHLEANPDFIISMFDNLPTNRCSYLSICCTWQILTQNSLGTRLWVSHPPPTSGFSLHTSTSPSTSSEMNCFEREWRERRRKAQRAHDILTILLL